MKVYIVVERDDGKVIVAEGDLGELNPLFTLTK